MALGEVAMESNERAHHTKFDPVFVLGSVRSGTSLTCRLLLDHLGVNFGTESQFLIRYHRRAPRYGDLRSQPAMRRLLTDLSRERFFARTRRNFGFVLDIEQALRSLTEATYPAAVRAVFEQFAATKGLVRWGDKTPEYNEHLDTLLELFPNAQFVHVVRDPRDVAVSVFKTGFGAKHAYEAAMAWRHAVNRIESFGARLPATQFLHFRYECLLDDPVRTLDRVAAFLGISNHATLVSGLAGQLRVRVRENNARKWQAELAPPEISCIEAMTRPILARYGYETVVEPSLTSEVSRFRMVRWQMQGLMKRALNRRYWADNVYRLRLRFRDAQPMRRLSAWS
jgi:hypothetical protein